MKKLNKEFFKRKLKFFVKSKMGNYLLGNVDTTNIGAIFALAVSKQLSSVGHFIVLPLAAATNIISSLIALHQLYKNRHGDKKQIVDPLVTIGFGILIVLVVIFSFAGVAALFSVAPIVLTAAMSAKSIYDFGAGCYCWYKYFKHKKNNPEKAQKYFKQAKDHTINFLVEAFAAAAAAGVLIANKASLGTLGVVGGGIGMVYTGYEGVQAYKEYKAKLRQIFEEAFASFELVDLDTVQNELTNNALLHAALRVNAEVLRESKLMQPTNEATNYLPLPPQNDHLHNEPQVEDEYAHSRLNRR